MVHLSAHSFRGVARSGASLPSRQTVWYGLALLTVAGLALWAVHRTVEMEASVAALFFLLGTPHGASEPDGQGGDRAPGLGFTARYLVLAGVVFALWWLSPVTALLGFLAASAWHFGQAETHLKTAGLAVVLGSLALYPAATLGYFGALTGSPFEAIPQMTARLVGFAALGALAFEGWRYPEARRRAAALVLVLLLLPPILAVATYFLFFHALDAYRVGLARHGWPGAARVYGRAGLPAMLGGLIGVAVILRLDLSLVWLGGLAVAFVVPHLVLDRWGGRGI